VQLYSSTITRDLCCPIRSNRGLRPFLCSVLSPVDFPRLASISAFLSSIRTHAYSSAYALRVPPRPQSAAASTTPKAPTLPSLSALPRCRLPRLSPRLLSLFPQLLQATATRYLAPSKAVLACARQSRMTAVRLCSLDAEGTPKLATPSKPRLDFRPVRWTRYQ
jgi:hypothetical protein